MKYRIDAENLIVGNGEVIKNGLLVIENEKIIYAGEDEKAPKIEYTKRVNTLMPGMWECHGHFIGINTLDPQKEFILTDPMVRGMRTVDDASRALYSGITSVRDAGGSGIYLRKIIEEKTIQGPNIYSANSPISMTGGHGDFHSLPSDVMCTLSKSGYLGEIADGVAECLKAVRKQLRKGAEVIKIHASGGILSELDHPIHQQYSFEEVKVMVDEAARAERVVMAHCHGKPGIRNSLQAGVKTIEHGSYLDEELADLMIEKDAILVPTRLIGEEMLQAMEVMGMPEFAKQKMISL